MRQEGFLYIFMYILNIFKICLQRLTWVKLIIVFFKIYAIIMKIRVLIGG